MSLDAAVTRLRAFARDRDWTQFHNPKNLAVALTSEAAELQAIFQWLTPDQATKVMADPRTADSVRSEVADVMAYLLQFADSVGVDVLSALDEKISLNERRYPADQVRGRADKYDRLREDTGP